jgi:hypothetical protein
MLNLMLMPDELRLNAEPDSGSECVAKLFSAGKRSVPVTSPLHAREENLSNR